MISPSFTHLPHKTGLHDAYFVGQLRGGNTLSIIVRAQEMPVTAVIISRGGCAVG